MNKLFVIKELSVKYSSTKKVFGNKQKYSDAVNNVSFDFIKGEVLGIVGESGSGKSTVSRCLLSIIKHIDKSSLVSGSIVYNEGAKSIDLLKTKGKEIKQIRKKIQGVFQDPDSSMNQRLTAGKIIEEPLLNLTDFSKEVREEKIKEVLQKCGLSKEDINKYPNEFSAGQKQRICIARALVIEPEILIADEPLSSLDISIQAQILNLFVDLKEKYNLSIVFITHDLNIVKVFCDRIIVMKDGKIVEHGNTADVLLNPKNEYTKTLFTSNITL
jgi:peptide/nickel transport system ATP-binding protein/oligopeptide transport system ATP-binding protein